jgi:cyclophilin family peptidyl-prolyl cis-trans isomerase
MPAAMLLTAFLPCCLGGTLAQFRTPLGDLDVELYDAEKPATTANFKRLVMSGAYVNTFFHRVVPGFVAQGGGFFTYNFASTNLFAPPWSNLGIVPNFGAVTNEFNVGPLLSNTNGTIAMAKSAGNPNSATCQWFFNLATNSTDLDSQNGGFTVFGRVVRDTGPQAFGGLLGYFNNYISYNYGLQNVGDWYVTDTLATNSFRAVPVLYGGPYPPRYIDLIYLDITLLSVKISSTNGANSISWRSVEGKTNRVEFTTNFPPVWQTMVSTNGDGSRFSVLDASVDSPSRFYRVQVLY